MEFVDLQSQRQRLGKRLDDALASVLAHGRFINGPEVGLLEKRLAEFCGARHAVACASGTDALLLGMMALGVGRGDAVLVPSFSFVAPAEVVRLLGATPVFLDADPATFNLDPESIAPGVTAAKRAGLRPVGLIAVDLFGRPADYPAIESQVECLGLWLVADAAQSFGARSRAGRVGNFGVLATTSFYPSKPLGCYGDGGAIFTGDDALARELRSLLSHGCGAHAYDHVRVGINGRLDTIQAAILLGKLDLFAEEIVLRDRAAGRYRDLLSDVDGIAVPVMPEDVASTWAQYTMRLLRGERESFREKLRQEGVPSAVHYPVPLHRQPAFRDDPIAVDGLPAAERLSEIVISLPMHPYLTIAEQERVAAAVRGSLATR